jgi:hypothetical protein
MGSMRDARRAGTHADNTAKEVSNKATVTSVGGSNGCTSNNMVFRKRTKTTAPNNTGQG